MVPKTTNVLFWITIFHYRLISLQTYISLCGVIDSVIGDKKVVHLTGEAITNSSDQSEALFTVAGKQYTKAAVKEDDFLDVAEAFDKYERNCKDTPKMT
jgi:hypothetical protein